MKSNLSILQLRAIKRAIALGRTLQKQFPEIAEDYENGLSKAKIIEKYDLIGVYRIGKNVAENAVAFALKGHNGYLRIKPYQGLIKDSGKLEELASKHQAIAFKSLTTEQRSQNGRKAYNQKKGVHGFSREQRKEMSRRGGIIARDNKLGFHSLTKEEKAKNQRKAMIASGKTPYTPQEKQRILQLSKHPSFQCDGKGPSYIKIAKQINNEFHKGESIRTRCAINYVLFRASKD